MEMDECRVTILVTLVLAPRVSKTVAPPSRCTLRTRPPQYTFVSIFRGVDERSGCPIVKPGWPSEVRSR